jgi:hypothetical protein
MNEKKPHTLMNKLRLLKATHSTASRRVLCP